MCFRVFSILVRKYRNATVYIVCASAPWFITIKTMLEFIHRHSLAKGVIHFSVICISLLTSLFMLLSNFSSCPQEVRQGFLASGLYSWVSGHRDRRTWPRPSRLHCFNVSAGVLGEYLASGGLDSVNRTVTRLGNANVADLSCWVQDDNRANLVAAWYTSLIC